VDLRAVLDAVVKRKIPSPRWESNSRTPIVQCRGKECVELYLHSPNMCSLCGAYLSTGYIFVARDLIKDGSKFPLIISLQISVHDFQ
jgi:hypothetical protein